MAETGNVVVVRFTDPSKAYQAPSVLKECDAEGRIGLESAAIVERTESGELRIPEATDNVELLGRQTAESPSANLGAGSKTRGWTGATGLEPAASGVTGRHWLIGTAGCVPEFPYGASRGRWRDIRKPRPRPAAR